MQVYGFLEKAQLENASADLANALAGLVWFNTSDNKFRYRDNGAIRSVVNEDQAQVLTNKTLTGNIAANLSPDGVETISLPVKSGTFLLNEDIFSFLDASHQVTPSAPGAGNLRIYAKDDNNLYKQDSEGNEVQIGTGGGGLDIYHTEDFEVNNAADMDSGNSVSFLGGGVLAGSLSDLTGGLQFAGNRSLRYTQAAGSLNDYFAGPVFDVPVKARGNKSGVKLFYSYTGADSDIKPEVYDVTNGASLVLETVRVKSFSNPKVFEVYVDVPLTCTQMRWGFHVKAVNDGAVLTVDDIQFNADALAPVDTLDVISSVLAEGSTGSTPTPGSTDIEFTEVKDTAGAWDGNRYTVQQENSIVSITCGVSFSATISHYIQLFKNGSLHKTVTTVVSDSETYFDYISHKGEFSKGDQLSVRVQGSSVSLSTASQNHYINIVEKNYLRGVSVRGFENVDNENEFGARIDNNGSAATLISESSPFIETVTRISTGRVSVVWKDGVFTVPPTVQALTIDTANSNANVDSISATGCTINQTFVGDFTGRDNDFYINVQKQGADFVKDHERTVILPSGLQNPVAHIKYNSSNTELNFTGSAAATIPLEVVEGDNSFLNVSSNQITLPAGEYDISWDALMRFELSNRTGNTYLYDVTNGVEVESGTPATAEASASLFSNLKSTGQKRLQITSQTTYELRARDLGGSTGAIRIGAGYPSPNSHKMTVTIEKRA